MHRNEYSYVIANQTNYYAYQHGVFLYCRNEKKTFLVSHIAAKS